MAEEGTGGAGSIEIPQPLIISNPKDGVLAISNASSKAVDLRLYFKSPKNSESGACELNFISSISCSLSILYIISLNSFVLNVSNKNIKAETSTNKIAFKINNQILVTTINLDI